MAKRSPLTWKDVVNNVFLKLISTGQLPVLAFIALLIFMVGRTPPENIVDVWRILHQMIERRSGLGYALAASCGGGWIMHTRWQRRRAERELDRVTRERTEAQQKHFKKKLESSDK